jgi:hypothetical protein
MNKRTRVRKKENSCQRRLIQFRNGTVRNINKVGGECVKHGEVGKCMQNFGRKA